MDKIFVVFVIEKP